MKIAGTALLTLALVVGLVAPAAAAPAAFEPGPGRDLWVWDRPGQQLIDFSLAEGIRTVYLHAGPGFDADPEYRSFVDQAHQAGLRVVAMAGDPQWAQQPADWEAWIDEVAAFGAFDGLLVDVEPYLLTGWSTKRDRNRLIRTYLRELDAMAATGLPTAAAVPFWWDDPAYRRGKRLLIEHVMDRVDAVVVMAYRDHADGPDGILDIAATEADLADATGTTLILGVQTAPDLDKVTFFEEGRARLEVELAAVAAAWGDRPSFGGFAIHYFRAFEVL